MWYGGGLLVLCWCGDGVVDWGLLWRLYINIVGFLKD